MNHPQKSSLIAAAVLCMGAAGIANAQGFGPYPGKPGAAKAAAPAVAKDDLQFMEKAAAGGLMEVELGQIAQQRATNAQVKQFGARMVQDHGKAGEELKKVASAKGVALPSSPTREHRKHIDDLKKVDAARFDQEYMQHMVKDHREDIKAFDQQAKSGKDADVKSFAAKTLPTLHEHLKLAESAQSAVRGAKK